MRNRPIVSLFSLLLTLVASHARADPVLINFETGTIGAPIDSFYAAQGITFLNAEFASLGNFAPPSRIGFAGINGPGPTSPIIISFATPATLVRVTGIDLRHQGLLLTGHAADGTSLGSSGSLGGDPFGLPITFALVLGTPAISSVEVFQPQNALGTAGGALFDDLVVDTATGLFPTPEPGTSMLFATGLSWLVFSRFKRDSESNNT